MVPTLCWLLVAAACFLWGVPFRGGRANGAAEFWALAGSYVRFSALVFVVTAVVVLRRVPEDAYRPMHQWLEGGPPADERPRRRGR